MRLTWGKPRNCCVAFPRTRTVYLRLHDGVPVVCLYTGARLHRNERWCDRDAVMPNLDDVPMQPLTAGPGFIAETQPASRRSQLLHQLSDMIGSVRHRSPLPDFPATLPYRNR